MLEVYIFSKDSFKFAFSQRKDERSPSCFERAPTMHDKDELVSSLNPIDRPIKLLI